MAGSRIKVLPFLQISLTAIVNLVDDILDPPSAPGSIFHISDSELMKKIFCFKRNQKLQSDRHAKTAELQCS